MLGEVQPLFLLGLIGPDAEGVLDGDEYHGGGDQRPSPGGAYSSQLVQDLLPSGDAFRQSSKPYSYE